MPRPAWLAYSFAVVMVAISVYCVGRLALARRMGRRNHGDVNVAHVLMGVAMAGMLAPSWRVLPVGLWQVVFGAVVAYFLVLSVRFVASHGVSGTDDDHVHHLSHYAIHLLMACAMLYMYWLGSRAGAASGVAMMTSAPGGPGDPGLTFALIGVLVASAVWQLDSLPRFAQSTATALAAGGGGAGVAAVEAPQADVRPWLAPRLEVGCHIAMCVAMAYMLVLMV